MLLNTGPKFNEFVGFPGILVRRHPGYKFFLRLDLRLRFYIYHARSRWSFAQVPLELSNAWETVDLFKARAY